jgi:hypothetical protein
VNNTSTQDWRGGVKGPYGLPDNDSVNGYVTEFVEDAASSLMSGPAEVWFEQWSYVPENAAMVTKIQYNAAGLEMEPWKGEPAREELAPHFKDYSLVNIGQKGAIADYFKLAPGLPVAWSLTPDALALAMQKKLGKEWGALVERALATPQATNDPTILDAWGYKWLKASSGSNNPNTKFKPVYGSYYNLTYGQAMTAQNILAADIRLRGRRGQDGDLLGLKPRYLIVNFERVKEAELLIKKLRLVPVATGDIAGSTTYVTGDSAVIGEYEIIESLQLPKDTFILSADPATVPVKMRPFVLIRGLNRPSRRMGAGGGGMLPSLQSGLTVGDNTGGLERALQGGIPEFWIEWHGTDSALFQLTKKVAVDGWVFNGVFPQDGRLFEVVSERAAPV